MDQVPGVLTRVVALRNGDFLFPSGAHGADVYVEAPAVAPMGREPPPPLAADVSNADSGAVREVLNPPPSDGPDAGDGLFVSPCVCVQ